MCALRVRAASARESSSAAQAAPPLARFTRPCQVRSRDVTSHQPAAPRLPPAAPPHPAPPAPTPGCVGSTRSFSVDLRRTGYRPRSARYPTTATRAPLRSGRVVRPTNVHCGFDSGNIPTAKGLAPCGNL